MIYNNIKNLLNSYLKNHNKIIKIVEKTKTATEITFIILPAHQNNCQGHSDIL